MAGTQRTPPSSVEACRRVLRSREAWLRKQGTLDADTRAQTVLDLEDLGNREETTQRDYVGRYPIELVQNAHDACADARIAGTVHLTLTPTALLVGNEGRGFDAARIRSLTRQGMSEKAERSRKRTIGYKGVGFSSVFEITSTPQVICNTGLAFGFDRQTAIAMVHRHLRRKPRTVAARNFPSLLAPTAWSDDAVAVTDLFERGCVTVIRLPLNRRTSPAEVFEHVVGQLTPETLLFLPSIRSLRVVQGDEELVWTSRQGARAGIGKVVHVDDLDGRRVSWLMHSGTVAVEPDTIDALDDPAWRSVGALRVTVGLPWGGRTILPDEPATPVHLYFPTSETTGRSCLIHGDFYVDSRRAQILDQGAPSAINLKAADKAADLLAELATSVAPRHAGNLFAALAATKPPSTFGAVINRRLLARLKAAPIGRPADGGAPRPLEALTLITDDQPVEMDQRLMQLMSKRSDLLRVEDYISDRATRFVQELGIQELEAAETAARVTIANSRLPYENALVLLNDWLDSFDSWKTTMLVTVLKGRNIVKDVDDRWCRPRDAVLSVGAIPPLPPALRKRELKPLRAAEAKELLARLDVEELDAAQALALAGGALRSGDFGAVDAERQELHDWLLALWRKDPSALPSAGHIGGLQGVWPVPARSSSGQQAWQPARGVYFGAGWSDNAAHTECLYAADDRTEFLAVPPRIDGGRRPLMSFYISLGVSELPRQIEVRAPAASKLADWQRLPDVARARTCPDGHQVRQDRIDLMWDRLDDVIQRAVSDDQVADALTALVASAGNDLSRDAKFICTHSHHRGRARSRTARSYQSWRLNTAAWLRVTQDPGASSRRAPNDCWIGIPRTGRRLLLPQPVVRSHHDALRFVNWERPPTAAVERALDDIRSASPDGVSVDAAATADVLLRKLESSLLDEPEPREALHLLAHDDDRRVWSEAPVVADIPGLERLPGVPVLDIGIASKVRRAYGLTTMSTNVTQHVHPSPLDDESTPLRSLLPADRRTQILVLLSREGADRKRLARNLNRVVERAVASIDLEVIASRMTHWREDLPFKLIAEGEHEILYTTPVTDRHLVRVAHQLAGFLTVAPQADRLALVLTAPDEMAEDLLDTELAEARELLTDAVAEVVIEAGVDADNNPARPDDEAGDGPTKAEPPLRPQPRPERATFSDREVVHDHSAPRSEARMPATSAPAELPADGVGERPVAASGQPDGGHHPETPPAPPPDRIDFGRPEPAPFDHRADDENGTRHLASTQTPDERIPGPYRDPTGQPRSDEETEQRAIEYVTAYALRELGVEQVIDRQADKVGWDLEFHHASGAIDLVEVKGSGGSGPFGLTVNELTQARAHDNYVLFFLADQRAEHPILYRFDDLGARIKEESHLRAASWWVKGWRELNPLMIKVIPHPSEHQAV